MFFDDFGDISNIARKTGVAVFWVPDTETVEIPGAIFLRPEGRVTISVDQVRSVINGFSTKQLEPRFVVIRPADKMTEEAENAILKSLEEPEENVHYLLITSQPHKLLPTILSRAGLYIWRGKGVKFDEVSGDKKTKELARELLKTKPGDLVDFAEKVTKTKDGARMKVLDTLAVAIEMCYKTYFLTGKAVYLKKATKMVEAHDNISANGHLKLHLVADLV